jgi:hypothetical protein
LSSAVWVASEQQLLKEDKMESIVILVVGAILFDLAARFWAVDSRENVDSHEWERRRAWGK